MILFPAIDLKDGNCVRLFRGDMQQATVFHDNPAEQARIFQDQGFAWIHVVDLNGAVAGHQVNEVAISKILDVVDLPIQLGGGIRSLSAIEGWLKRGITRVVLGTAAVNNQKLVREACLEFPGQVAVGRRKRPSPPHLDSRTARTCRSTNPKQRPCPPTSRLAPRR